MADRGESRSLPDAERAPTLLRRIAHGLGFHEWRFHEAFGLRDDHKVVRERCACGARRERYVRWEDQRGEYD